MKTHTTANFVLFSTRDEGRILFKQKGMNRFYEAASALLILNGKNGYVIGKNNSVGKARNLAVQVVDKI